MKFNKKKGLGRGLTALFGDQAHEKEKKKAPIAGNIKVQVGDLSPNKYQPRVHFDEDKLDELANSIKKNGIIQPIAVREDKQDASRYQIVAGERRWLAAQRAGLHEVPIVILDLDDNEALEVAIVENIQRDDLNVIEEAKGYQRLVKEFGYDHEKISQFMSKSRSHVSNTLRLLSLPEDIIGLIEEGKLTGAFLDVFEKEPLPKDSPLWRNSKIKITPHIASLTYAKESIRQALDNFQRVKNGGKPLNEVSRDNMY